MSSSELFSGSSESEPEDDPVILQTSGDSSGSESKSGCGTGREVDRCCRDMSSFFPKRRKTNSENVYRLAGRQLRREPAEANSSSHKKIASPATPVRFRGKASSDSGCSTGSRVLKENDKLQPRRNSQMHIPPTTPRPYTFKENKHMPSCSDHDTSIDGAEVKSALKEITSLLNAVVKCVERVENELQRQHRLTPSSSSDSTPGRAKPHVPLVLRVNEVISLCTLIYTYWTPRKTLCVKNLPDTLWKYMYIFLFLSLKSGKCIVPFLKMKLEIFRDLILALGKLQLLHGKIITS